MRDVQVLGEKKRKKQQELFIKKQLKQLARQSTSWRDKENNT
jgi:hypothetical protein